MNFVTTLAGIKLEHPLMNGPGTCKSIEDVKMFARSSISAVNVGSITVLDRPFNPGNGYWSGPHYALNSLGMPNPGKDYYVQYLPEMVEICHAMEKALILNVAGFEPDEYALLANVGFQGGADLIELNLGCPNVWNKGRRSRIVSFDPPRIARIVRAIEQHIPIGEIRIGVKLSPYSDPGALEEVADTISGLPVSYVATCNTFPNSFVMDEEGRPVIGMGYAGLSGEAMKPVGLGQVRQLRERLKGAVEIVGLGGVLTGRDIADYLQPEVGANAVAATTAYWRRGENPSVYGDMLSDYVAQFSEEG